MKKVGERLSAVRDVIAHLGHPDRLRENVLTSAQFDTGSDPAIATARVQCLVERALGHLSLRQREIVERCDLQGQSHPGAIASLGISERHFYRERRSAFESIAAELGSAQEFSEGVSPGGRFEAFALQLGFADASHQVGDSVGALRILGETARAVSDPIELIHLHCRLAELCAETGAAAEALRHVRVARKICARLEGEEECATSLRLDAVAGSVAWRSGDSRASVELSERVVPALRNALDRRATPLLAEALSVSLLALSERDLTRGRWKAARRQALEAFHVLSINDTGRPALGLRAESAATTAHMLDSGNDTDAAFELERLYRRAIARGLALEATLIAWHLFYCHRFAGKNRLAVSVLERVFPIAAKVIPAAELAVMSLDLASGYIASGESAKALRATSKMQQGLAGSEAVRSQLIEAEAFLLERDHRAALRSSQRALDALRLPGHQAAFHYVTLGVPAEGWALRIAADASRVLGELSAARDLIGASLGYVDASTHPAAFAKIHLSAARITGKRAHRRAAERAAGRLAVRGVREAAIAD